MLPNLKSLRKKERVSQQALADALGVSQQSINQYENTAIEPDIYTLCRLADFFHTTIDFIVGREISIEDRNLLVSTQLSQQEYHLLEKYRALKPAEQQCAEVVINTLLNRE